MFIEEMQKTLNEEFNESRTENGALGYRTTGKTNSVRSVPNRTRL